jgi:galactose mutarotase-like enzyme
VTVELVSGYPFAQVYAPAGQSLIALEPMTAPTNALTTGRSLPLAAPGERFSAVFRIGVEDTSESALEGRDGRRRASG